MSGVQVSLGYRTPIFDDCRWVPMDYHGNKNDNPYDLILNSTEGYKRAREGVPNSVDTADLPTLDTCPCPLITLLMGQFCRFCWPDLPQTGSPRCLPPHNPADGPILPILLNWPASDWEPKMPAPSWPCRWADFADLGALNCRQVGRIGTTCTFYLPKTPAPS